MIKRCLLLSFTFLAWFLFLSCQMGTFNPFFDLVFLPLAHMVKSSLIDHFSLCVLYEMLKGSYSDGRELRMKWTRNYSNISISNDLNWATISLISIMCLHTPLVPSNFIEHIFVIRVLAKTLLEVSNYFSIALRYSFTLAHSEIEP